MSITTLILVIILICLLVGAWPAYGRFGAPGGLLTVLVIVLLIFLLTGRL